MKNRKIPHLEYMEEKSDTENLKSSLRIASKNLKKFVVIYYEKMYLHAYFQIFLSHRVLRRKKCLTIDFSPCYSYGKLKPFVEVQTGQIGPSHHTEYFLLFFWKLFTYSDTGEKVDSGYNERPKDHGCYLIQK